MSRTAASRAALARLVAAAGIRPVDLLLTAVVAGVVDLFVAASSGPGQQPLDGRAYLAGVVLAPPILFRRRWPLGVLIASAVLLLIYYATIRRNIPPTPVLSLPVYDAVVAGYLPWAIGVPAFFVAVGLILAEASHRALHALVTEFLPRLAGVPVILWLLPTLVFPLALVLGELVRGRRALAAETERRLRAADAEREAEAARKVAEERLRIARELHDTVAHGMATITVQAGTALHLLGGPGGDGRGTSDAPAAGVEGRATDSVAAVREALTAIRATSKDALTEMRATLRQLRQPSAADARAQPGAGPPTVGAAGLGRLPALRDAVVSAGVPVTVAFEGTQVPLPDEVDHAAYRILQESLTNVLRHAGPAASAGVRICFGDEAVTLEVTDDGNGAGAVPGATGAPAEQEPEPGHGLAGMTERAAAIGGDLTAGPRPGGGFGVTARLPLPAGSAAGRAR